MRDLSAFIKPQLATLAKQFPRGSGWIYEQKFDGYRLQGRCKKGIVTLLSRNGLDWTQSFPKISEALPKDIDYVVDGEAVAVNRKGRQDFQTLQGILRSRRDADIQYHIFDIMELEGTDIRGLPLLKRKDLLRRAIFPTRLGRGPLHFTQFRKNASDKFLEFICASGGEGVVCKDENSAYTSGRSSAWIKVKCTGDDDFLIGGFTLYKGCAPAVGALLLGARDGSRLLYKGKVGTGFSERERKLLYERLKLLALPRSPFFDVAKIPLRDPIWVKPVLFAQVSFSEITADGILRHPSFKGIRKDK